MMKATPTLTLLLAAASLSLPACHKHDEHPHHEHQKIVTTSPLAKDVTITQQYVCLINSQKHIEVCAMEGGRLEEVPVKEGQVVKEKDLLFKILPVLYQTKLDAEKARVQSAQLKYNQTLKLFNEKVVSQQDVLLHAAELAEAMANQAKAEAEVGFTEVRAPFPGIVDRQERQLGSVIKEGEVLTSLSDNRVMWVRFNVPEKRYFEYMTAWGNNKKGSQIELTGAQIDLMLADGTMFKHSAGQLVTVEGKFNRETGNISFRADFPNPEGLLRQGQTGTIMIRRKLKDAVVIPQRATFEILDKRYVWVVGTDHKVHQREIAVEYELDDVFVLKSGVGVDDRIVFEGVRQVHENDEVECVHCKPETALANQKFPAE